MTIQTAVLIETLKDLGASVRWASCNIYSTQDHVLLPSQNQGTSLRMERNELGGILGLYIQGCFPRRWVRSNLIVDDGGDATLLLHKGDMPLSTEMIG